MAPDQSSGGSCGRPGATGRVWNDLSDSTRIDFRDRLDRIAADLNGPRHPADRVAMNEMLRDNLLEVVNSSIASRVCRFYVWATPRAMQ